MKLATLNDGSRDGKLVVVSRDLARYAAAANIAQTMQAALEGRERIAPRLQTLSDTLNSGEIGGEPFDQGVLDRPVAIVMGSEPHGLDRDVDLDAWAHIAMPGRTESLNVAMAGTLLLHEASRS